MSHHSNSSKYIRDQLTNCRHLTSWNLTGPSLGWLPGQQGVSRGKYKTSTTKSEVCSSKVDRLCIQMLLDDGNGIIITQDNFKIVWFYTSIHLLQNEGIQKKMAKKMVIFKNNNFDLTYDTNRNKYDRTISCKCNHGTLSQRSLPGS